MLLAHAAHTLYWVVPVAVLFAGLVALTWVDKRRGGHESANNPGVSADERIRAFRQSRERPAR